MVVRNETLNLKEIKMIWTILKVEWVSCQQAANWNPPTILIFNLIIYSALMEKLKTIMIKLNHKMVLVLAFRAWKGNSIGNNK